MKIKYQPELDGIRALAIIGVVLYHAKLSIFGIEFTGGYIGVDVFIVLSGYLISKILKIEFINTGKISLTNFFIRRAKRILPALFFVIIISYIIGYFYLLPISFVDFSKSSLSNLFLISNYYFHFSGLEYQAEDAITKPLLHTWSLSLEAQFYIIFAILFFYMLKKLKNTYILLIAIITLNIIFCEYYAKENNSANFYFLSSRFWEFIVGYFAVEIENKINSKNNLFKNFFQIFGFILILFSFIYFNDSTKHPSLLTLIPVIGCFFMITCSGNNFFSKIISLKPIVGIGLVSYSLYLWHFPLMAYYRVTWNSTGQFYDKMVLFLLILIGTLFSYFFIEKKFKGRNILNKKLITYFLCTITLIVSLNVYSIFTDGFKDNYLVNGIYLGYEKQKEVTVNKFSKEKNKKNVLVIGNSHARDFYNILANNKKYSKNYNFSLYFTQIYCLNSSTNTKDNKCKNKNIVDKYNLKNADAFIITSRWSKKDLENIEEILKELIKDDKEIYIISSQFNSNFYKEKLLKRYRQNFTLIDEFLFSERRFPEKKELETLEKNYFKSFSLDKINNDKNVFLKKISNKYNLNYFDRNILTCNADSQRCKIFTPNNKKLFSDPDHFHEHGFNYLGNELFSAGFLKNL